MFVINYDKILEDKEMPIIIKDLAREIKKRGAIHVGEWIRSLSTADLWYLNETAHEFFHVNNQLRSRKKPDQLSQSVSNVMIVLTDVLSCAESIDVNDISEVPQRIKLLSNYISSELLVRKGVNIRIKYESMTLDLSQAAMNRVIETEDLASYVSDKMKLDEGHKKVLNKMSELVNPNADISDEKILDVYKELMKIYDPKNPASVIIKKNFEGMMMSMGINFLPEGVPNFDNKLKSFSTSPDGSEASMILAYDKDKDGPLDEFISKNIDKLTEYMGGGKAQVRARVIEGGQVTSDSIRETDTNKPASELEKSSTDQTSTASVVASSEDTTPKKKNFFAAFKEFLKEYRKSNPGSAAKS